MSSATLGSPHEDIASGLCWMGGDCGACTTPCWGYSLCSCCFPRLAKHIRNGRVPGLALRLRSERGTSHTSRYWVLASRLPDRSGRRRTLSNPMLGRLGLSCVRARGSEAERS